MASTKGERPGALFASSEKLRRTQHRRRLFCFYGRGQQRGFPVCPRSIAVNFLTSSVLMLLLWTPSHIFLCVYATLGDICGGAATTAEQSAPQRDSLLKNNSPGLWVQKQTPLLERMAAALKRPFPRDLRVTAGKAAAAGGTVGRTHTPEGDAIGRIGREQATAAAATRRASFGLPATTAAAERRAESTTELAVAAGSEARRLLGGDAGPAAAAKSEARRLAVEPAGASGTTAAVLFHASHPLPSIVAAAGKGKISSDGNIQRQTNFVQTENTLAQQLQERGVQLPKRFAGGVTRRLMPETGPRVGREAARTERASAGVQTLQSKFDELLADVAEYGRLRRQREFNEIAEMYADEDEIPENEISILKHARSELRNLKDRKSKWISVILSSLFVFACAVSWIFLLLSPIAPSETPLTYAYLRQRQIEFRIATAVMLGALLMALYGDWRRRTLNWQIYLQELDTDRITFEALAGVRPTKKNVLGPSRKEIVQHRRALEKKAKEPQTQKQGMP